MNNVSANAFSSGSQKDGGRAEEKRYTTKKAAVILLVVVYTCSLWELCQEMHSVRCIPISISITKCPIAFLVNFTITSGKKYGQ